MSATTAGTIGKSAMLDKDDIWQRLAAPIPPEEIQWRQDGRPVSRDGKHIARFVAFIDAQFVQSRFDEVVPGEWDLTLELLPPAVTSDGEEVEPFSFKARLQVLGVIREDVGSGKDYKTASTDAFKRAAVRFGVGRELYAMHPNFVQMDGDGKYAKPVEDPAVAYARRYGTPRLSKPAATEGRESGKATSGSSAPATDSSRAASSTERPSTSAPSSTDTPESVRMPFGKHKGTPLGEIDEADLVSTIQWASKTDKAKFAELIANCQAVIDRRAGAQADAFADDEPPF